MIGLPGDRVRVQHGQVFINGRPLDEPYITFQASYNYPLGGHDSGNRCCQVAPDVASRQQERTHNQIVDEVGDNYAAHRARLEGSRALSVSRH